MKQSTILNAMILVAAVMTITAPFTVQSASTTTMNFQGELTDNTGSPLTGDYNMEFSIFDSVTGGFNQWPGTGLRETHSMVTVTNGIFSVILGSQGYPLAPEVFTGGDRFLEVRVCSSPGSGCSAYETLSPRQQITGNAYTLRAMSFQPGITVANNGTALSLQNTGNSGSALRGLATNILGSAAGVYGESVSPWGAGVSGYNTMNGYGVYGGSNGGYGVYSNGDAHVNGSLTWAPRNGWVSISPSAFNPVTGECSILSFYWVIGCATNPDDPVAQAGVHLPHGATLVRMKVQWIDSCPSLDGHVSLISEAEGGAFGFAEVYSSGSSGTLTATETTDFGDYSVIDNENNTYAVIASLPQEAGCMVRLLGVHFEYSFTGPY